MQEIRSIHGIMILVVSLLACVGVSELALRLIKPEATRFMQPPRPVPENVWRAVLHRPSSIPRLSYELVPGRQKYAKGHLLSINSHGMRDRERTLQRDASSIRIAVLGDSMTFGFWVDGDETYSSVLERLLDQFGMSETASHEVLNFGVGGYSSRDEAVVLKHKIVPWKPDLVLIGYVLNDPEIEPLQPLHRYYQDPDWWQYSYLIRGLAKLKRNWDIVVLGNGDYRKYLHAHPKKWMSVIEAFQDMKDTADKAGFKMGVIIWPDLSGSGWDDYSYHDIHKRVADLARANDFRVIELYEAFSRHNPKDLRISDRDSHANPLGHALAAKAIHEALVSEPEKFIDVR